VACAPYRTGGRRFDRPCAFAELKQLLSTLLEDTAQLGGTVRAVESQRAKFLHVSEAELSSRKQFIAETTQVGCPCALLLACFRIMNRQQPESCCR